MVTITARNLAYDVKSFRARAGAAVTVSLQNTDAGVAHDVTFGPAPGGPVALGLPHGNTCFGPCADRYTFAAPSRPGRYLFFCTVHEGMEGEFFVDP
jgi:plastocyanin